MILVAGRNERSQLGDTLTTKKPRTLDFPVDNVSHINLGQDHSIFTLKNGDVFAAGDNTKGIIFDSDKTIFQAFKRLPFHEKIKMAACGACYTLYMTFNGELILFSNKGRFNFALPKQAAFIFNFHDFPGVIDSEGAFYLFYNNDLSKNPKQFVLPLPAADIGISESKIHVLLEDGVIYTSETQDIDKCVFSIDKSMAKKRIWQLSGFQYQCLAISFEGEVFDCNTRTFVKTRSVEGKRMKLVAAGGQHSLFLTEEGDLYSCGLNSDGQLLLGHTKDIYRPTKVNFGHECFFVAAGSWHSVAVAGGDIPVNLMKNRSRPKVENENVVAQDKSFYLTESKVTTKKKQTK